MKGQEQSERGERSVRLTRKQRREWAKANGLPKKAARLEVMEAALREAREGEPRALNSALSRAAE